MSAKVPSLHNLDCLNGLRADNGVKLKNWSIRCELFKKNFEVFDFIQIFVVLL